MRTQHPNPVAASGDMSALRPVKPERMGERPPKSNHDSLPIIDISQLNDSRPFVRRKVAARIGEVAMDNGFLYLSNHGVSADLIDAMYRQSERFFSLLPDEKLRYYIGDSANHRGYVPTSEKGDYGDEQGPRRYEAFDMGLDRALPFLPGKCSVPLVGENIWPALANFKPVVSQYLQEMQRLSQTLCRAFEVVLGAPNGYFSRFMRNPMSQLRLLHYLDNTRAGGGNQGVNMGAHTDYELFTILHSRSEGLEVLDLNSQWIKAPPLDGTFYFNIGDMLEAWSGGLFVATPHRVVNNAERYSMPFFAATDYNVVISPIHSKRYSDRQRDYAPIVAGKHLVSQLLRDFPYLRERQARGQLRLNGVSRRDNPFEARMQAVAGGLN